MRRSGKEARNFSIVSLAESGFTSHNARPDAPCSRRAVPASSASVPTPPVTDDCQLMLAERSTVAKAVARGFYILIALPTTLNRNCALSAGRKSRRGGSGFVRGLFAVDNVISGNCLPISDFRLSSSLDMLHAALVVLHNVCYLEGSVQAVHQAPVRPFVLNHFSFLHLGLPSSV